MIARNDEALPTRVEASRIDPSELLDQQATGRKQLPLVQVLWRRRWTLLLTSLGCILAAAIYLLKATPIYTSTSRVYVDQTGPKLLTTDSEAGLIKSDSYLYTQAQILSSTPILTSALQKLDTGTLKTFAGVDNPLVFLRKALLVDVGKKDDLISVSLDSASPQEAAMIVNDVVDAYVTFSSGVKRNSAAEVMKILEKELEISQKELDDKLAEMMKFKRENGALSFQDRDGNIIIERLSALQQSMTTCELEAAEAAADQQVGEVMMKDPEAIRRYVDAQQSKGPQSADAEYGELQSMLLKYKEGMVSADMNMGDRSRIHEGLASEMAAVNAAMQERAFEIAKAHMSDLGQRLAAAQAKEAAIKKSFESQQQQALDLNAKATEFAQLQTSQERLQDTVKLLQSRIKETNVTEDSGALNIQVLEVARPEAKATKPRKELTLAVALLLGLMLGTGAGLTQEWMDRKLRSPDEIISALGIPVLGIVPHMKGRLALAVSGQNVHKDSMSEVAEAYRTIRTAIQFGTRNAEDVKTILVTSPTAGDGKSTSASNLAIAFAQAGYRTLIVDCDLRKPMQHKIFEVEGGNGLTNVVAGQMKLGEAIVKSSISRLSVLPCGPLPSNPSELLNGKRFSRLVTALVTAFDKIIIDSPPVAPVTDARVLAASADVTLLVLRADKSTDRQAAIALDGLRSVGGVVIGAVMNDMPRRKDAYGYYTGYYYYGKDAGGKRKATIATDIGADHESLPEIELHVGGNGTTADQSR